MDDPNFDNLPDEMKLEVIYNLDIDSALSFCSLKEYSRFCYSYRIAEYFLEKYYPHLGVFGDPFTHLNKIYNDESELNLYYAIDYKLYEAFIIGNRPPRDTLYIFVTLSVSGINGPPARKYKVRHLLADKVEYLNDVIEEFVNEVRSMLDAEVGTITVAKFDLHYDRENVTWQSRVGDNLPEETYENERPEVIEEVVITSMYELEINQSVQMNYNNVLRFIFHIVEHDPTWRD